MLPVRVSHDVLARLADALDEIAGGLDSSASVTRADFGMVQLPDRGFAATAATGEAVASALRTLGAIEAKTAETAAVIRHASTAYSDADRRGSDRWAGRPW